MIAEKQLLREWADHPARMVRELFGVAPDPWQEQVLEKFPTSPRLAMKACKGPGKTAVLAWIGWNFLLTRPHPKIAVTSITGENLKSGLWAEFARWRDRAPLLQHLFEQTKTEIFYRPHPTTWRIEARTWARDANPDQIGAALAGVHAPYVMWLLDESGAYPPAILPTCEAIFAGTIEAHIVQAGNPLNHTGALYRACVIAKDQWTVVEITGDPDDPMRSPRIPVEYARDQIRQYGRDNPWVLVNIFGQFPPTSINALIGPDEVRAAMKRYYREHQIGHDAPRIMGVDVAREIVGDASACCRREGVQCYPIQRWRGLDSTQGAGQIARIWNDWGADACFIDMTGGFGAGWYDGLARLGKAPIGVQYAGKPHNTERYANKRAEMYFEAVQWIKRGGALPDSDAMLQALTQTTYAFKGDKFILEPKEDVIAKIGHSPDEADAFVQTFAEPIVAQSRVSLGARRQEQPTYEPFAELDRMGRDYDRRSASAPYNPFVDFDRAMR